MNNELFNALDALESEKGISKEYMLERIEAALLTAFKKAFPDAEISVVIDPVKKECRVFKIMTVVDQPENPATEISLADAKKLSRRYTLGSQVKEEIKTKNFSRTVATSAKQVIIQGIREAERGNLMKEYENKREDIVTGTVEYIDPENGSVIVNTGTSNAALIKNEQIPGEVFKVGDCIKVFITEVSKETKGRLVTISRVHAGFVRRLFELNVPEIADGTVVIKGIVREAGSRTKMAVYSTKEEVDPIGACIGNKGARIAEIVNELNGEKIDVIKYSEDPSEFIAAALSPAVVKNISFETDRIAHVTVSPDQLSLAIGKEGQNARLAAKLTGCKIDIKAE
ncbi:MAG: transcription termination/antitermination protein NusA [Clostridia bacterium]|nr:transcription termination/antitermination protein NusA [Clostridia bacterium]